MHKWKSRGLCLLGVLTAFTVVSSATAKRTVQQSTSFEVIVLDETGGILDDATLLAEATGGTVKADLMPPFLYHFEGTWKPTITLSVEHPSCGLVRFELETPADGGMAILSLADKIHPEEEGAGGPPNDLCADAIPIAIGSLTSGTTNGAGVGNAPSCGTTNNSPGVWYSVIGDGTSLTATFCSGGGTGDYDTKLSVYCGGCDLTVCVSGNDDTCGLLSQAGWCAEAGTEYLILVHGFGGQSGNFTLNLFSDDTSCTPTVDCDPGMGACCFIDGVCIVSTADNCDAQGGQYQGDDTECSPGLCEDLTPANDDCEDALGPLDVPSTTLGTTFASTLDDVPFCGTSNTTPGVWYTVIGTGNTMTASTCGDLFDYDTKLGVFCSCDDLVCIGGNDDNCSGGASVLLSTVDWCSQAGATYHILVHGFGGQTGDFELFISDDGVPCQGAIECIQTGACCVCVGSEAVCTIETEADCLDLGGTYLGDGTICDPAPIVRESTPNAPLPDNDPVGITDEIMMGASFEITDLDIDLEISHTWVGDLCITLEHNGTVAVLVARPGADTGDVCHNGSPFGCSENNYDIILDDEGSGGTIEDLCIVGMTSPPNYTPFEALSVFDGMDSAGLWTINVSDNAAGDTGTLVRWSLHFPDPDAGSPCDVVPCEIVLPLDIKPGSCPNSFNRGSNGVLPVGLLGTMDFDITQVDVSSVVISRADGVGGSVGPNEGPPGPHSVFADVGTPFEGELCDCHELEGDGITDLSMKFRTQEVVDALELNDLGGGELVELCVSGVLLDGTPFVACDCIRIVPPGSGPLSVTSNVPEAWITVYPMDDISDAGGFTNFVRTYENGAEVQITAEPSHNGIPFFRWRVNGRLMPANWDGTMIVEDQNEVEAIFQAPIGDSGVSQGQNENQ